MSMLHRLDLHPVQAWTIGISLAPYYQPRGGYSLVFQPIRVRVFSEEPEYLLSPVATGLQAHISTPSVIPTVERESIDLNNRFIRTWNVELLRVAGIVARLSWNSEMAELKHKLSRALESSKSNNTDAKQVSAILPEALFLQ